MADEAPEDELTMDDDMAEAAEPSSHGTVRPGTLLGTGGAGLLVGVLVAFLAGQSSAVPAGTSQPTTTGVTVGSGAPVMAVAGSGAAAGVVDPAEQLRMAEEREAAAQAAQGALVEKGGQLADKLADLHGELHKSTPKADLDMALKSALDERYADSEMDRGMVRELLARGGVGRFVRAQQLTPLGKSLMQRLSQLEVLGVPLKAYDRDALKQLLAPVLTGGTGEAAGRAEEMITGLLASPVLDREQAAKQLATLGADFPSGATVDGVIASASMRAAKQRLSAADIPMDVALAGTLYSHVLDMKYIKRVGPHKTRSKRSSLDTARERNRVVNSAVRVMQDGNLSSLEPTHPHYRQMVEVSKRYTALAAGGGCKALPTTWRIKPGMHGDKVKKVQKRLNCEGYYDGPIDGKLEGEALVAVKEYQRTHNLSAEGYVYKETLTSMNVPIAQRRDQLRISLQRLRESELSTMGDEFIRVNIPSFRVSHWKDNKVIRSEKVVVGTNRLDDDKRKLIQGHLNRTKLFKTNLYEIVTNPAWILPPRVQYGELVGAIEKDPKYLDKMNIKQVKLPDGSTVFRQGVGAGNVLGKVKFLLENSNAIYLHDTNKPLLFRKNRRDFSHGCVRVENAKDFATWLLERDGFTTEEIERALNARKVQRGFKLRKPIPLITEYVTVDIDDEGWPIFYGDIYGYDVAYKLQKLPVTETIRWGDAYLRPHWVPKVSKATVAGWKKKGLAAPRKYDPKVHGE